MHVLIISDSYPNAYLPMQGVFVRDQARALASTGTQVGVIACIPVSLKDLMRSGLRGLSRGQSELEGVREWLKPFIQIPKWYSYPIGRIAHLGMPMIEAYAAAHGVPDIVHLHGFHAGKLALWVREKYRMPLVVTEHNSRFLSGSLDQERKEFAFDLFRRADARIAVSSSFRKKLETESEATFTVIPNAVNVHQFKPSARKDKFIFLSAGRFDANKNQQLQIQSFAHVFSQMPETELWLAGDGELRQECEQMVRKHSLEGHVRFLGFLSREELIHTMQQSTVFLISSKHETFGVVAIEAMSCGLFVISTPCGGTDDTVRGLGRITDSSVQDFADAMKEAYFNRDTEMTDKLHQIMNDRYSYEAVASSLMQLYSHLLLSRS